MSAARPVQLAAAVGATLALLLAAAASTAAVRRVPDDPGCATIAAALARSAPGDVVLVASGRYAEHDLVLPAGVELAGDGDATAVVIDAQRQGRALLVPAHGAGRVVRRMSLVNGLANGPGPDGRGGAVLVAGGSPRFEGCLFTGNEAVYGGAVHCRDGAAPAFARCGFADNTARASGGALAAHGAASRLEECWFSGNSAAQGGGAVQLTAGAAAHLTRATFAGNEAPWGAALAAWDRSAAAIDACIAAFNGPGRAFYCDATSVPAVACTDVFANDGGDWVDNLASFGGGAGNLSADPLFCAVQGAGWPLTLRDDSPCGPFAGGACGRLGAFPVACMADTAGGGGTVPLVARLYPCAPNPFNPGTAIRFHLPRDGRVTLRVHDAAGRLVRALIAEDRPAGPHEVRWDGRDGAGRSVASGVYFCRLEATGLRATTRAVLLR